MSKVPIDLSFGRIVAALERDGWPVTHTRGSHIHLEKVIDGLLRKTMVPAHRPVQKTTLAKLLRQGGIRIDRFLELL